MKLKESDAGITYFKNLTKRIEWLADEIGLSVRTITKYINGDIPEKLPKLKAICDALQIHPSQLLLPHDRLGYEAVLLDLQELRDTCHDVRERNQETARLSRELLRWQRFFDVGRWEEIEEYDDKDSEIDRELDERGLGR